MFNESINFNISYGKIGANKDDVEKVAALADIHSKVLVHCKSEGRDSFYNSVPVVPRINSRHPVLDCCVT